MRRPKLDARHRFVSRAELAEALGLAVVTLEGWAREGRGPRPVKLGIRRVGYRVADVEAWIDGTARRTR